MAGLIDAMMSDLVRQVVQSARTAVASSGGAGGGGAGTIASVPPLPAAPQQGGGGTPRGGGGFSGGVITSGGPAQFNSNAGQIASTIAALPDLRQRINMDLATSQAVAFGSAGSYGSAQALQRQIAMGGTVTSRADAMIALQQASLYGMGTGANLGAYTRSAQDISNIMPGLGVAGAGQAFASMQSAGNVNMLRAMGINIRTQGTNTVSDMNSIVNQIWSLLTNLAGRKPTREDIQGSMLPGNFLYRFLSGYGGDPNMQQAIYQALLAKAAGATSFGKSQLERLGFTTGAITSESERTARQMETTQITLEGVTRGFEGVNRLLAGTLGVINAIGNMPGIKQVLNFLAGTGTAVGTMFKENGGPTQSSKPYIVGEKGPELFIPKENGTIIPNHMLPKDGAGTFGYAKDGTQYHKYATGKDIKAWARSILMELGAPTTEANLTALGMWAQREGGWTKNKAEFNPLNTKLPMPGSFKATKYNVKGYTSMDQGVEAVVSTLTGNRAKERGYTDIVNALKTNAGVQAVLSAVNKSAWVHGEGSPSNYDFKGIRPTWQAGGAKTGSFSIPTFGTSDAASPIPEASGTSSGTNWLSSITNSISNFFSNLFGGGSGSTPTTGVSDVTAYMNSLKAGPQYGQILKKERGIAGGRALGGTVQRGTQYEVGERGPEVFVPNTARSAGSAPNITYMIDKLEMVVPEHFSEEKILEVLRTNTSIKAIEHKARIK